MSNEKLIEQIRAGENVKDNMLQLWEQTQNLCYHIAKKYAFYADIEDLMQEGFLALYNIVNGYDPQKGAFSTYAFEWFRQRIQRYVYGTESTICIPEHCQLMIHQYRDFEENFRKEYGREPTNLEAAAAMNVRVKKIIDIKDLIVMKQIVDIEAPVQGTEDIKIVDSIKDNADIENTVIDNLFIQELKGILWPLVNSLPDGLGELVMERYKKQNTFVQMAAERKKSYQEIKNSYDRAMRSLSNDNTKDKLLPFAEEYIKMAAYKGCGVGTFNKTWTSSTERTALKLCERY